MSSAVSIFMLSISGANEKWTTYIRQRPVNSRVYLPNHRGCSCMMLLICESNIVFMVKNWHCVAPKEIFLDFVQFFEITITP